jgi:hypothetical protein
LWFERRPSQPQQQPTTGKRLKSISFFEVVDCFKKVKKSGSKRLKQEATIQL